MNENVTNSISRTNWARVDALTDEEIDTSDAPALAEDFFARAKWRMPTPTLVSVTVQVDSDVLAWFQAQGEEGERRMTAALRIYAAAHKAA